MRVYKMGTLNLCPVPEYSAAQDQGSPRTAQRGILIDGVLGFLIYLSVSHRENLKHGVALGRF